MSDGLDGLELAIELASGATVLGGAAIAAWAGRLVADGRGWRGGKR